LSYHYLERLENAVRLHEQWRNTECLNLIVSENFASPEARKMLTTDFCNRYTASDKFYRGSRFTDEVQALAEEVARKVFNARFADVRPLSGHIADMSIVHGLTRRGDKVLSVDPEDGGYQGFAPDSLGGIFGVTDLYFPYDKEAVNIDARESIALVGAEKPNLIVFGSSFIPFPHPVKDITEAATEEGAVCVYDGSHVMGLLAGGEFQDPLREGCSLLMGSTHKSFPGPQGGIVLGNSEEVFKRVATKMYPAIVDNIHWNRVASLALTLTEMLQFGKSYAQAVIKNSQTLGKALADKGVMVRGAAHGYSKSHQVLLAYDKAKCEFIARRLEESNIIIDNLCRVGTSEATRMGMGPAEMEEVADIIATVIQGKKPADIVKKRVKSLIKDFKTPRYVLRTAVEAAAKA
jgi:glycine hydroxymethyltransferase